MRGDWPVDRVLLRRSGPFLRYERRTLRARLAEAVEDFAVWAFNALFDLANAVRGRRS